MKKPISHLLVKSKLFIVLLILLSAFTSNAQWTYTTTVKQTGKCIPYPSPPNGGMSYMTKSACEAARQSDLSNSGSDWSTFGDGSCTTIITCTPCMGSDISTPGQGSTPGSVSIPGQVNPGDVSINGILEGKAIFTSHQSSAFEDWAFEYKQLLATYGITSILGKNFTIPKTPLTGDKYFDALYTSLSSKFNPTVLAKTAPNQDASVVDLSDKQGIVGLLRTNDNTAKENEWLQKQGYILTNNLNISDLPSSQLYDTDGMISRYGLDLIKFGLVGLAAPIAIEGAAGIAVTLAATAVISLGVEEVKALSNCVIEEQCLTQKEILVNALPAIGTDLLSTGLGISAGKLAENSKFVEGIVSQEKIANGVSKGIAKLSAVESKINGVISGNVEKAFGLGFETGSEWQTLDEIQKKWSGQ